MKKLFGVILIAGILLTGCGAEKEVAVEDGGFIQEIITENIIYENVIYEETIAENIIYENVIP